MVVESVRTANCATDFPKLLISFLNRAASGWCCPSVRTVTLQLHAIFIIRTDVQTVANLLHSCLIKESIWTVAAVFLYLCLRRKSFYLSNTEWSLDVLLRRPNGCNLKQFEACGHWWESRRNNHVVRTDVAWLISVRTIDRDVQTDTRDSTSLSWNPHKIFLKHITDI
jgi:hypothetical protein